ncbi:MAG: glycosyltransferase family 4 protein [Candidatus Latescibacterota bacterium]
MRICHLIYDDVANPWLGGGGAVRVREVYSRLANRHAVTVITGRFPGARAEEVRDGVCFQRVGTDRGYAVSRLGYCLGAVPRLRQVPWDVWVNEFSPFAPLRVPAVVRRRGLLLLHHFVGRHALWKHPVVGWAAWLAERRALRGFRHVLTGAPSVQREIERRLRGRPVTVHCVGNGVARRYFELQPAEDPYILYFGRVDIHTKGLDLLLDAFARIAGEHPEVGLRIAGRPTGSQSGQLARLVAGTGVAERIRLEGAVDEPAKCELLRRALFVCMPSRYEGWGIVAVEGAAASKAVLGTRIPGLADAVQDGATGLLVAPGDAQALAAGMRVLLGDPAGRQRMGQEGRRWARRFNWDELARQQEEVYAAVLQERA